MTTDHVPDSVPPGAGGVTLLPSPVMGSANVFCEGLASTFGCAGHTASMAPQESNQTTQT